MVSTSAEPVCVYNVSVGGGVDVGSVCVGSGEGTGVDSDKVTVDSTDSVKVNVMNKVTADAMLANAGKGDLFSDGGMNQDEGLIGNRSEGECLTTRFWELHSVEPQITHVQSRLK